jgi:hypothetical protein
VAAPVPRPRPSARSRRRPTPARANIRLFTLPPSAALSLAFRPLSAHRSAHPLTPGIHHGVWLGRAAGLHLGPRLLAPSSCDPFDHVAVPRHFALDGVGVHPPCPGLPRRRFRSAARSGFIRTATSRGSDGLYGAGLADLRPMPKRLPLRYFADRQNSVTGGRRKRDRPACPATCGRARNAGDGAGHAWLVRQPIFFCIFASFACVIWEFELPVDIQGPRLPFPTRVLRLGAGSDEGAN